MASSGPNGASSLPTRPPGPPPGAPPGGPGLARPPGPPPGGPQGMPPAQMYGQGPPPFQGGHAFPPYAPSFPMGAPPPLAPLPPGWSEHLAPDGVTKYYYNTHTKVSSYRRPIVPGPYPSIPNAQNLFQPQPQPNGAPSAVPPAEKKKKEKPKQKVPIGDTPWTRVTTSEGRVFYHNKDTKKSEWTTPDEIKDQVLELENQEKEEAERKEAEERDRKEQERLDKLKEQERIRLEVEEERAKKRKQTADSADGSSQAKKPKTEQGGEGGEKEGEVDPEKYGPQDEEDEAAWMKAVAAEFAEADQRQIEDDEEAKEKREAEEAEAAKKVFAVPEKVNVSVEEGRALFKALLIEKDISPFAPWDQSLPLFINDPRYVLLSSMKDRREVYEEYCRDIGRARRLNKGTNTTSSSSKADPERDYKALLREEVTSTRTRWDDFRKKWKKDRRFYSFGREDRDREKVFKTHLKELGERKRADAQRAESDFMELLKETEGVTSSSVWADVKKGITKDSRYDAVGSSSLREELFATYIKKLASSSSGEAGAGETAEAAAERKLKERKVKAEASLKEREAKIRQEKERVGKEVARSQIGAGREEGERLFSSLLVDQVRDPSLYLNDAAAFLRNDPRFNHPSLSMNDKLRLYSAHMTHLSSKRSNALHDLFTSHASSLATEFDAVYPHIIDDPLVKRMNLTMDDLEDRFRAWQRTRESEARGEFDEMLKENSFVEFWGGMRKKTLDEQAEKVKELDELEEGEGMGDGGGASLTDMSKQVDLNEIKAVLRRDKRYRVFDHKPDLREKWLREYLEQQEVASGSKTIHNVGPGR